MSFFSSFLAIAFFTCGLAQAAFLSRAPSSRTQSSSGFSSTTSGIGADGFIIEPSLAYEAGRLSQSEVTAISTQTFNIAAKVGYRQSGIGGGLGYALGFGSGQQANVKGDYKPTDMGVFLSYGLPFDTEVYGFYLFNSQAKIDSGENSDKFSGSGTRLGLSWSGLSYFTISLEIANRNYSKYAGTSLAKPLKSSTSSVSIGFPL